MISRVRNKIIALCTLFRQYSTSWADRRTDTRTVQKPVPRTLTYRNKSKTSRIIGEFQNVIMAYSIYGTQTSKMLNARVRFYRQAGFLHFDLSVWRLKIEFRTSLNIRTKTKNHENEQKNPSLRGHRSVFAVSVFLTDDLAKMWFWSSINSGTLAPTDLQQK